MISTLFVAGNTILQNALTVSGTTSLNNATINGYAYTYSAGLGVPATGVYGGTGSRVVLFNGAIGSYPFALGMDASTMWYRVPSNSSHKFYADSNLIMYINTSNTVTNNPIIGNSSLNNSGNPVLNGTVILNGAIKY